MLTEGGLSLWLLTAFGGFSQFQLPDCLGFSCSHGNRDDKFTGVVVQALSATALSRYAEKAMTQLLATM